MAKRLPIYHVAPDYLRAARAGFNAMRKDAPHARIARKYREHSLGAAIYYAQRTNDPKPEIIRVLLAAPALRQCEPLKLISELPMPALFFELEAFYNNPNTRMADFKALSPMGQEAYMAMQSYEAVLNALSDENRKMARNREFGTRRPALLN